MILYSDNLFAFMKSKTLVEFVGLYYIYMYIMRCMHHWNKLRSPEAKKSLIQSPSSMENTRSPNCCSNSERKVNNVNVLRRK